MTALRSFVSIDEAGGVTRAAGFPNLTQSAVSMQIKRLEGGLGVQLVDRSARKAANCRWGTSTKLCTADASAQ